MATSPTATINWDARGCQCGWGCWGGRGGQVVRVVFVKIKNPVGFFQTNLKADH